ncbi:hypothetical protein JOQ06_012933, partial [Pogonophryne albipinna]
MEDRSSDRSPDSIEPSPSRESPCPDSLEGSPTQSKESECEIPAKTAVYEDYASQLKACYNYDNNIYMDDSERGEPEINYEIIQNERGIKEDIHSCSESITGNMFSDSNICDSKNLHMCIRQDSLEADDSENDATNKHLTPEEDMFKMAAKIKTFDEMDQEYNMKRDKLETGDLREDHPDQNLGPGLKTLSQNTPETLSEATVDWQDDADRKEETLAIVADLLGFSWTELARELEFSEDDIKLVRTENPNSLQEQSHALLQRWVEREGKHATEDCLIKRLTKINRMDIVHLIETQMNKSVQEQTSRTYAEIEKTLDHSEVSVALSLVQEDADSPRIVRRVESDRRPPPAVSEEDLSVASLLDITSWAEPAGHTHSESMHGDLLEDLEIPHELNPNLWTSEDFITQEPTSNDHSNEQDWLADFRASSPESVASQSEHWPVSPDSPVPQYSCQYL